MPGLDLRPSAAVVLADSTGSPTQTLLVHQPTPRWEEWAPVPLSVTSAQYEVTWQTPVQAIPAAFYEAIWQVNSDDIYLHVEVGGIVLIGDMLLETLDEEFKLKSDEDVSGRPFSIWEYESKRWSFKPPVPISIPIGDQLKISFRAKGDDRSIERGISVWGA